MTEKYQCPGGEFTFVWQIKNFRYCALYRNENLRSPDFMITNLPEIQHHIYLCLYRNTEFSVRCYLDSSDSGYNSTIRKVSFQICACSIKEILYVEDCPSSYSSYFVNLGSEIIENLPDDTLVLHCHFWKQSTPNSDKILLSKNPVHCFAETRMKFKEFVFHHKVERFSSLQLGYKVLTNHAHPSSSNSPFMILGLFLEGRKLEDATFQIRMNVRHHLNEEIFATCSLYVEDDTGKTRKHMLKEFLLGRIKSDVKFSLKRSKLLAGGFPNDTIILRGEMKLPGDLETGAVQQGVFGLQTKEAVAAVMGGPPQLPPSVPKCRPSVGLSSDMLALYKGDGPPSDFALTAAGGRQFPVHQTVLGARSSFFRAMFSNEQHSPELTIDLDADTLDRMLRYAYSDEEPQAGLSTESLVRLYSAADEYGFAGLREICAERLMESIDVVSAPKIVQVAHRLGDGLLKSRATAFILAQGREAIECEEWKELEREDPKLALDLLREMVLVNAVKRE